MPWKVKNEMALKIEFIQQYATGRHSMTDLCFAFGISRKTGYKYLARFADAGRQGLEDARRLRTARPSKFEPEVWDLLFAAREKHPTYGPRKLVHMLAAQRPELILPSIGMVKIKLRELGLVLPRKRRRSRYSYSTPPREYASPNSVWCLDFKGWFTTKDKKRYEPMTLVDGYSRYLLLCKPVPKVSYDNVRRHLEEAFKENGLPEAIRTDNGPPFGSARSLGGITRLGIWLLKLGIWPEKIPPGKPYQNGRIERLHRTINEDVIKRHTASYEEFLLLFDEFINTYNTLRPHEELEDRPPASRYVKSDKPYRKNNFISYSPPPECNVIRVDRKGYIRIDRKSVYISETLAREHIEIEETPWGRHLSFMGYPLGYVEKLPGYK